MFADLHCHAHMRSYLCLLPHRNKYETLGQYNPWTVVATNIARLKNTDRGAGYSQSDLVALWNSNTRLVWNALYPIERGFFTTPQAPTKGKYPWLRNLLRVATHHKAPLRTLMQHLVMRIPNGTIHYVRSEDYDYWQFLQEEYDYISSKSGTPTKNEIFTLGLPRRVFENSERRRTKYPNRYHAEGMYQIPRNRVEAQALAERPEEVLLMALSIEGAHIFGGGDVSDTEALTRVDHIKQHWEYPLFFITFSHHFYNHLCGHAHSLPDVARLLLNQDRGMHEGFTPLGWQVMRRLLALDANNNKQAELGYRILIDIKHMSPLGRKEWYEQIVRPCLAKGDAIPIIASHCGYSGRKTLNEFIENEAREKDGLRIVTEDGTFNAWGINLCDEDIHLVYETGGLIGLSFDKRIMGVSGTKKEEREEQLNSITALWNNAKAMLRVIYERDDLGEAERRRAWHCLAIGTDFDGYIDPIASYKTAIELADFKRDLMEQITLAAAEPNPESFVSDFDDQFTPAYVVDQLCYGNARDFTLKHYPVR